MNTLPIAVSLTLPIIQDVAVKVHDNESTIHLLSFVVAGFASLMMWLSYRRIRSEKWVMYFAMTFAVLSLTFLSLELVNLLPTDKKEFINVIVRNTLSILSNVFGVAAALEIQNRRPLFPRPRRNSATIREATKWDVLLRPLCWVLAALSGGAIFVKCYLLYISNDGKNSYPLLYDVLAGSPDFIFSAICLYIMGYAIFANLGTRHFPVLARVAFIVIAVFYTGIQLAYGLRQVLAGYFITASTPRDQVILFVSFLVGVALILKICLCVFAYLLVVRFFEILSGLGELRESEFERRQDYLSSEGVVEWIARELSDKSLRHRSSDKGEGQTPPGTGFVNLVVRLPGESEKRVACIVWPNYETDKRPKILDWWREEKKFSPLSTEVLPERIKPWEWEAALLPFVHDVLTDKNQSEIVWVRGQKQSQPNASGYNGNMRAVVSRAIEVNGAAIGCLQIARSDSHFSQMSIRQIRQIADMLSSAVQSYRELAGLDLMSIIFAKKESEKSTYSPEAAAELIITILHDIFAPAVSRLSMDFGFTPQRDIFKVEKGAERLKEQIEKEIWGKEWDDFPPTIVSPAFFRKYQVLKKQLTARVTQSHIDKLRHKKDAFIMGNLLFAVDAEEDKYEHPVLGINYLHRKTASTLAADAYLDFSRDYYGELLKLLGKELSARRLSFEEWFKPVQKILIEDAKFTWVVVRQRGRKSCFGDEEGLLILHRMKSFRRQVTTERFSSKESPEIKAKYTIKNPQGDTKHILKLRLSGSEGFIWLGVRRSGFGPELNFSSPWKTFLVNFAQIADASLSRITIPEKFKAHVEAAQLQGIIASVATTGTMIHQFSNMIAGQLNSIKTLRTAIALGALKTEDRGYEDVLRAMSDSAESMLQIFKSFNSLTNTYDHRPCRLVDAARHACKLFEVSLIPRGVKPQIEIDENIFIGVSFNVAALALATLVGNSKDAVKDGGMIRIDATQEGDTVSCRVIDNGRGITCETQNKIFEPKTRTKEYGTGMGLYLTSHSLSENESSIELTRSDENGSVFTLRFPSASKEMTS